MGALYPRTQGSNAEGRDLPLFPTMNLTLNSLARRNQLLGDTPSLLWGNDHSRLRVEGNWVLLSKKSSTFHVRISR